MSDLRELKMTFDPNTIQHLGIKMYSNLPAAVAEMVANAYDADAHNVLIHLLDDGNDKSICIKDDGCGMSFEEINDKFLKIGRNCRIENYSKSPSGKRFVTGKKGLGKLALFGLGSVITVRTCKKGEQVGTKFTLEWEALKNWDRKTSGPDYKPIFESEVSDGNKSYTEVTISHLKRKTTFNKRDLAISLSKMFNFGDVDFSVKIQLNNDDPINIARELRYENLKFQFSWEYPNNFNELKRNYINADKIKGYIYTADKPLKPSMRGVSLFASGRLVNLPEFYGRSESSHFYAYTTGLLDVDFVDNAEEDLISTNRQSLDWEKDETIELRSFIQEILSFVQADWRKKRKEINMRESAVKSGIDREPWLESLPEDKANLIRETIEKVLEPDAVDNPSLLIEDVMHKLVPEYAELHWRYLNEKIVKNDVVCRLYRDANYFQAAGEAVKYYVEEVRKISGATEPSDSNVMQRVFGSTREGKIPVISVTDRNGLTEQDIEEGQKWLSAGLMFGFKNPVVSHSTEQSLRDRGLFCEKDCLDILSLLSHLFDRLSKRKSPVEK